MKYIGKFSQDLKFVLPIFLIWRIGTFLLGLLAFKLYPFKASFPYIDQFLIVSGFPQGIWHWGNFDGIHYLDIAEHGYHGSGVQVFFPLYPLLIKAIYFFIPNYLAAALVVSHAAILVAALVFYRLVKRDFNRRVARWSVIFLFAFPVSFFFGAIYTESLFLLLVLLAYYWGGLKAGLVAALAGFTRLIGVFIPFGLVRAKRRSLWSFLGFWGILVYMGYLWMAFGSPFYFLFAQEAFRNERATSLSSLVSPPQVVYRYFRILTTADPSGPAFWVAVLELAAFTFGLVGLFWMTWQRRAPMSYLLFSWPALMMPTLSGTFSSMPRYLLTIFPLYILLAQIRSRGLKVALLVVFGLLLAKLTMLWCRGYWIS